LVAGDPGTDRPARVRCGHAGFPGRGGGGSLDWTNDPWPALTSALKDSTGRKGKALFLPLRQALTGMDHGPDMKALLPLIAQAEAVRRLS
jgi:glutamyl/glutaminyl-tRNA synthetase